MKVLLALGIMVLASGACGVAEAAPSVYSKADFVVISVVPRSPQVKPFLMAIPAKERRKNDVSRRAGVFETNR